MAHPIRAFLILKEHEVVIGCCVFWFWHRYPLWPAALAGLKQTPKLSASHLVVVTILNHLPWRDF